MCRASRECSRLAAADGRGATDYTGLFTLEARGSPFMFSISRAAAMTSLCLSVSAIAMANIGPGAQPAREVLPDTVTPTHYDLLLTPDADALTFRGKVA